MDQFTKPAPSVARDLIGCLLYVKEEDGSYTGGMIVETEAYTAGDAASHSYRGKTDRNQVMFGPAGHIYVYLSYGMHWCMNIVTGHDGDGEAVLIRAIHPQTNKDLMRQRRGVSDDRRLTDGPAKLCQALGVTGKDNGLSLGDRFVVQPRSATPKIEATERVGITKDTHRQWRFILAED